MIVRLIYYSTPNRSLTNADLEQILIGALKFNEKHNITGILAYQPNYFMQLLEGERALVNDLYHRILNDQRHSAVRLMSFCSVAIPSFSKWSMGFANLPTFPQKLIVSKYGGFNPPAFSVSDAIEYLEMLRDYLEFRSI